MQIKWIEIIFSLFEYDKFSTEFSTQSSITMCIKHVTNGKLTHEINVFSCIMAIIQLTKAINGHQSLIRLKENYEKLYIFFKTYIYNLTFNHLSFINTYPNNTSAYEKKPKWSRYSCNSYSKSKFQTT